MNLKNRKLKIIAIIVVILLLIAGMSLFVKNQLGPFDKNNQETISIKIKNGASVNEISNVLYENKLIKNKNIFKLYVKFSKKASSIKAGTYSLNQTYSNEDILNLLISGKVDHSGIKITIPEGLTSKEIIDILVENNIGSEKNYEKLINNPSEFYDKFEFLKDDDIISLEGFLYPETYFIDEDASEKEVLTIFLAGFNSIYTDEIKKQVEKSSMTLYEILNLASIIEKEAVLDEDRPIISSVFYNRLKIDMPLQSDATIQYIFEERKKIVTYADLEIDSPYNSYKNKGLPPTPIANPGEKSIEAALNPSDTEYLYFVAKMDGGNNYSKTYEQHLKYVKEYKDERDKLSK